MAEFFIGLVLIGLLLLLIGVIDSILTDWPEPLWWVGGSMAFVGSAWILGWACLQFLEWLD